MLTALIMEVITLLKALIALLKSYYTAIMASLDLLNTKVDIIDATQAQHTEQLNDISSQLETLQEGMDKLLTAIIPSLAVGIRMVIIVLLPMTPVVTVRVPAMLAVSE